jgi:hypothetical protein
MKSSLKSSRARATWKSIWIALVDRRIFPSINIERSGTRKEELLYHPDELQQDRPAAPRPHRRAAGGSDGTAAQQAQEDRQQHRVPHRHGQ